MQEGIGNSLAELHGDLPNQENVVTESTSVVAAVVVALWPSWHSCPLAVSFSSFIIIW